MLMFVKSRAGGAHCMWKVRACKQCLVGPPACKQDKISPWNGQDLFAYASPCNERSLRPYPVAETMTIMTRMAPPSACIAHSLRPKNTFHCEIFTQKFVRMVFVSYLCTARGNPRGRNRVYTCVQTSCKCTLSAKQSEKCNIAHSVHIKNTAYCAEKCRFLAF